MASLALFPSTFKVLTLKSTPIVAACSGSNVSSVNRNNKLTNPDKGEGGLRVGGKRHYMTMYFYLANLNICFPCLWLWQYEIVMNY